MLSVQSLTPDDLELIETLKIACSLNEPATQTTLKTAHDQGSISLSEICEILQEADAGQDIVSILYIYIYI